MLHEVVETTSSTLTDLREPTLVVVPFPSTSCNPSLSLRHLCSFFRLAIEHLPNFNELMKLYYTDSIELFSDLLTQIEKSDHKNYDYLKDDFKHLKNNIISYICKQNLNMLARIEKETLRDHLLDLDYETFQQMMLCLNDTYRDGDFSSLKNQKFEGFLIKTEYNYGDLLAKLLTIRNILFNNLIP